MNYFYFLFLVKRSEHWFLISFRSRLVASFRQLIQKILNCRRLQFSPMRASRRSVWWIFILFRFHVGGTGRPSVRSYVRSLIIALCCTASLIGRETFIIYHRQYKKHSQPWFRPLFNKTTNDNRRCCSVSSLTLCARTETKLEQQREKMGSL